MAYFKQFLMWTIALSLAEGLCTIVLINNCNYINSADVYMIFLTMHNFFQTIAPIVCNRERGWSDELGIMLSEMQRPDSKEEDPKAATRFEQCVGQVR
jgi:hypothetical protein